MNSEELVDMVRDLEFRIAELEQTVLRLEKLVMEGQMNRRKKFHREVHVVLTNPEDFDPSKLFG